MTPLEHFLAELSKRLPANANLSTFDLLQVLEACGLELVLGCGNRADSDKEE